MDVPAAVAAATGDESVAASVSLNGDDALFVTPTRTLVYRADGLLSNESVTEFTHDAERVEATVNRRKATLTLDYGLDGEESFTVPADRLDDALHPVLAGVLNAAGVTEPGETVRRTYRFSELTLVVTDARLVRHVGAAVWDADYDEVAFADVVDVAAEEGSVASQLVLDTTDRPQRVKVPNERFRDVREAVESALFDAHGVDDYAAFRDRVEPDHAEGGDASGAAAAFDAPAIDPIETGTPEADALVEDAPPDSSTGGSAEVARTPSAPESIDASNESSDASADAADSAARAGSKSGDSTDAQAALDVEEDAARNASASVATDATAPADAEPDVDVDALESELAAIGDALDEQRRRTEAQREVLDEQRAAIAAQLDALDEQRERVERALDAIRDP